MIIFSVDDITGFIGKKFIGIVCSFCSHGAKLESEPIHCKINRDPLKCEDFDKYITISFNKILFEIKSKEVKENDATGLGPG